MKKHVVHFQWLTVYISDRFSGVVLFFHYYIVNNVTFVSTYLEIPIKRS